MTRLSDLDAQFIAAEGGVQRGHYAAVVHFDTPVGGSSVTTDDIKRRLAERIHLLAPLRWRLRTVPLGLDHPYLEEVSVRIDDHVHEAEVDEPGDERSLGVAVSRTLAQPLDRSKPLWRVVVFTGLERGRVAAAIVLHHATIDGISAGQLFSALYDDAPMNGAPGEAESGSGRRATTAALVIRGLARLIAQPFRALGTAARVLPYLDEHPSVRSVPGVRALARTSRQLTGRRGGSGEANTAIAPTTPFTTVLSEAPSVAFGSLDLADVLAVKREHAMTVNDVVMALCGGALRRWLAVHDGDVDAPLLAFVPVSVRQPGELYGNRFSSLIARLPTDVETPGERLAAAQREMKSCKERRRSVPDSLLADVNSLVPSPLLPAVCRGVAGLVAARKLPPPINLIISSIPGSPSRLALAGSPILAQYPLSLIFTGVGLNITVVSYVDQVDVGIVATGAAMPDAWELLADIRTELKELRSTVPE